MLSSEIALNQLLQKILVWVDYSSIPQVSTETLRLAVQTLSAYSSLASKFVIVAPVITHADTGLKCDLGTYRRRTV